MLARGELPFVAGAQSVTLKVDLNASAAPIVQIEQKIANRALLDLPNQRRDRFAVVGLD